jgi:hypothetical protein
MKLNVKRHLSSSTIHKIIALEVELKQLKQLVVKELVAR